jgi:hypothetical protein
LTQKNLKDVAASVRQKLLNLAHQKEEDFQLVLGRFTIERFLYRLSRSDYSNEFLVKGATLFALWSREAYRPTRDLDLLGLGDDDAARILGVFRSICGLTAADDGIRFEADSVRVESLRVGADFEGLRVHISATLAGARISLQIDIGFGDVVCPPAEEVDFPVMLHLPVPRIKVYRRETAIAEKFDAMLKFGLANSRMKDFFDIWFLARNFAFEGRTLRAALQATLSRRGALPTEFPVALTPKFFEDSVKLNQWKAFRQRARLETDAPELGDVCRFLTDFLVPPFAAKEPQNFSMVWPPGGPWRSPGEKHDR